MLAGVALEFTWAADVEPSGRPAPYHRWPYQLSEAKPIGWI